MRRLLTLAALASGAVLATGGAAPVSAAGSTPVALGVQVVRALPHDPDAFTQGLELDRGRLVEGTGLYGRSSVRRVERSTGRVLRQRRLAPTLFGEGLTVVGDRIVQLTWRERVALVHDRASLRRRGSFRLDGEGWGICFDGRRLVTSDGTPTLTFRDPATFRPLRRVRVEVDGPQRVLAGLPPGPVERLNELECVRGSVYANVWQTDLIVRIDAATGRVTAVVDAGGLLRPDEAEAA
ncbi:MAG TPA: glutaminyl-peptide cyclotransferase, partial [Gaiellaceae bacterium]|nr:glutaminyl-peptide cyclotransferase [Gaiellaceae bacterium]